jgi:hypothetical protein
MTPVGLKAAWFQPLKPIKWKNLVVQAFATHKFCLCRLRCGERHRRRQAADLARRAEGAHQEGARLPRAKGVASHSPRISPPVAKLMSAIHNCVLFSFSLSVRLRLRLVFTLAVLRVRVCLVWTCGSVWDCGVHTRRETDLTGDRER